MHRDYVRFGHYYARKLIHLPLITADIVLGAGRFSRPRLQTGFLKRKNLECARGQNAEFRPKGRGDYLRISLIL